MPVPWSRNAGRTPPRPKALIPDISERGITLRQLRELRGFALRLCKVGLLKYPSKQRARDAGDDGKSIHWTLLNQYDITSGIIKAVIPESSSCSWVELVADGRKQPCRFFCSHFWGETFRDFTATVERHASQVGASPNDAYWVCVYANNQWQVELGSYLAECPFYMALRKAESTVVLLDKASRALQRLWCIFEMHETIALGKPLEIWTPLGMAGSALVSSGPVMRALENLNTARAQASMECDQRRIMNHVAGEEETKGLVIRDGQVELDPDMPRGTYEQQLLAERADKFQALTERIQSSAPFPAPASTRGCRIVDPALRGIALAQLRMLASDVQSASVPGVSVDSVVEDFVKPRTREPRCCSYVELIAGDAQPPDFYLCFGFGTIFRDLVSALEWHAEARELPDTTVYWIDAFALNQHKEEEVYEPDGDLHETVYARAAFRSRGFVMMLDQTCKTLSALWPLYLAMLAIRHGKVFDLVTWSGALATTSPFADGGSEYGFVRREIAQQLLHCNVVEAETPGMWAQHRPKLLHEFARTPDAERLGEPPQSCRGYDEFNSQLREKAAGTVLGFASFAGDEAAISDVMRQCPRLSFAADAHRCDAHGSTAVHMAAAAGQLSALMWLLNLRADANARDLSGETPLHSAALAGHAAVVRWLLMSRANPSVFSADQETALDVAEQNPAGFMGIDTAEVIEVLRACRGGGIVAGCATAPGTSACLML